MARVSAYERNKTQGFAHRDHRSKNNRRPVPPANTRASHEYKTKLAKLKESNE